MATGCERHDQGGVDTGREVGGDVAGVGGGAADVLLVHQVVDHRPSVRQTADDGRAGLVVDVLAGPPQGPHHHLQLGHRGQRRPAQPQGSVAGRPAGAVLGEDLHGGGVGELRHQELGQFLAGGVHVQGGTDPGGGLVEQGEALAGPLQLPLLLPGGRDLQHDADDPQRPAALPQPVVGAVPVAPFQRGVGLGVAAGDRLARDAVRDDGPQHVLTGLDPRDDLGGGTAEVLGGRYAVHVRQGGVDVPEAQLGVEDGDGGGRPVEDLPQQLAHPRRPDVPEPRTTFRRLRAQVLNLVLALARALVAGPLPVHLSIGSRVGVERTRRCGGALRLCGRSLPGLSPDLSRAVTVRDDPGPLPRIQVI